MFVTVRVITAESIQYRRRFKTATASSTLLCYFSTTNHLTTISKTGIRTVQKACGYTCAALQVTLSFEQWFPTFFDLLPTITPRSWVVTPPPAPNHARTTIFFTDHLFRLHTQLKWNKWQTIYIITSMRRLSLINAMDGPVFPCQFKLNKICCC